MKGHNAAPRKETKLSVWQPLLAILSHITGNFMPCGQGMQAVLRHQVVVQKDEGPH